MSLKTVLFFFLTFCFNITPDITGKSIAGITECASTEKGNHYSVIKGVLDRSDDATWESFCLPSN